MNWGRWIDHLPLWVALGATVATGLYDPGELALMALPLLLAALVETFRWDLGPRHRWLEVGALLYFLGHLAAGHGPYLVAIHVLYLLGGVRLALPKEPVHRRQLVLISFMLFLTTAMGTTDVTFFLWTLLWFMAATLALLQQSWEPSASLRRGALTRPPYARVPLWVGCALLFGAGFFLLLPRLNLGLRPRFLPGLGQGFGQAGLGDRLDLSVGGPILANQEVALRITPPSGAEHLQDAQGSGGLELLRGLTLEAVHGQRWEPADLTPAPIRIPDASASQRSAEFLFTPSPHGILTLPPGLTQIEPWDPYLTPGPGGSLRWRSLRARTLPLTVTWNPARGVPQEPRLSARRIDLLTRLEPEHEAARRASFQWAPDILSSPHLANTLEKTLRSFTYTLDNPSGKAANPLEDFLERTRAGHCEYFASALALMLRARGVPARVVNGYRLGPWIPEGGYFRISQNEAHSWVEYWHEGRWWTADPTPQGGAASGAGQQGLSAVERWVDALRYRWDRYVVRFSDEDQQVGLSWLQGHLQDLEWHWKAPRPWVQWSLCGTLVGWLLWRTRGRWQAPPDSPSLIRALRPLLGQTRRTAPPLGGETARAWLLRLGTLRPERRETLLALADAVDALAYGVGNSAAPALAKAEAAAWRGWKPTSR